MFFGTRFLDDLRAPRYFLFLGLLMTLLCLFAHFGLFQSQDWRRIICKLQPILTDALTT